MKNALFAALFKKYRLRSEFQTLSALGNALYEKGIVFEDSLYSHWQKGDRVPDRRTLLKLIQIFKDKGVLLSPHEANTFMESAGHGFLTDSEKKSLFIFFDTALQKKHNESIKNIEDYYNPLSHIQELINYSLMAKYYGYANLTYKNFSKITNLIYKLSLDKKRGGVELLSRLYSMRIDCLSGKVKPTNYKKIILESKKAILFAKQNSTSQLGYAYYIKFKMHRLELLSRSRLNVSNHEIAQLMELSRLSLKHLSKVDVTDKVRIYYSLAKLGLLLKDRKLFDSNLYLSINLLDELPLQAHCLKPIPWALKALGSLRFENDELKARKSIGRALDYSSYNYRLVHLFCHNSLLHILLSSKDASQIKLAEKIRNRNIIENTFIKDRFEEMRTKKNLIIGLA